MFHSGVKRFTLFHSTMNGLTRCPATVFHLFQSVLAKWLPAGYAGLSQVGGFRSMGAQLLLVAPSDKPFLSRWFRKYGNVSSCLMRLGWRTLILVQSGGGQLCRGRARFR